MAEDIIKELTINLETVLYQFVKLYDQLAVDHSLMAQRELKVVRNVEKLQDIATELHELGPTIVTTIKNTTKQEVEQVFANIVNLVERSIDGKLKPSCNVLDATLVKLNEAMQDTQKIKEQLGLRNTWLLVLMSFFAGCLIGGLIVLVVGLKVS